MFSFPFSEHTGIWSQYLKLAYNSYFFGKQQVMNYVPYAPAGERRQAEAVKYSTPKLSASELETQIPPPRNLAYFVIYLTISIQNVLYTVYC